MSCTQYQGIEELFSAYRNAAKAETARLGYTERVNYRHGNFVIWR